MRASLMQKDAKRCASLAGMVPGNDKSFEKFKVKRRVAKKYVGEFL